MVTCMGKAASLTVIVFMLAASVIVFQPLEAKGNVIVVPDDFPTINQAIQNAKDDDTIFIKQGIYNETLVIDKRLTIRGEDTNKTVLNGSYRGTVIQVRYYNVTITGLTILFSLDHNSAHRYYIRPPGNSSAFFVRHTDWEEGLSGIHLQNAQYCNISGNIVSDCGLGLWLTGSQYNTISGNTFVRNNNGLVAQTSWYNKIVGNTFLDGGAGVCLPPQNVFKTGLVNDQSSGYNTFVHNNFIGNQIPIESLSLVNTTSNIWDDGAEGNYWSTYNGTDSDGNHIGDQPYQIMAEYYTGYISNVVWKEQVYGVDNYPLMEPFNDDNVVVASTDPDMQAKQNAATLTLIEVTAAVTALIVIVALIVYFKKHGFFSL